MYEHILIAIDPESKKTWERALPEAVKLARTHNATLHVMTVVPDYGSSLVASFFPSNYEEKALKRAKTALHEVAESLVSADLPHQFITAHGRIHDEICRVAEEVKADLIVMASHKPSPTDRLIAPTAQQVLLHAPVSVLVVR